MRTREAKKRVLSNVSRLRARSEVALLMAALRRVGPAYVVGGAVRDWIAGLEPRDIDLVIDGSEEGLAKELHGSVRTSLGGHRIVRDGTTFDVWTLEKTWGLMFLKVTRPSARDYPRSVPFNVDGGVVGLDGDEVMLEELLCAFNTGILDLRLMPNPRPELQVQRAILLARKYQLNMSTAVRQYVWAGGAFHGYPPDASLPCSLPDSD